MHCNEKMIRKYAGNTNITELCFKESNESVSFFMKANYWFRDCTKVIYRSFYGNKKKNRSLWMAFILKHIKDIVASNITVLHRVHHV